MDAIKTQPYIKGDFEWSRKFNNATTYLDEEEFQPTQHLPNKGLKYTINSQRNILLIYLTELSDVSITKEPWFVFWTKKLYVTPDWSTCSF